MLGIYDTTLYLELYRLLDSLEQFPGLCFQLCYLISWSCIIITILQLYVHGEKFNQPIFHCNNISGAVEPVSLNRYFFRPFICVWSYFEVCKDVWLQVVPDNEHRALYSTHSFKILFKDGGCGTFVPLFLNLMTSVRRYNQYNQQPNVGTETRVDPLQASQTPVDEMMRHA